MAITHGQWKYIQAPRPELYDVVTDPAEKHNLVKQEPQRVRVLEDKLRETLEQTARKNSDNRLELDAESIKRLESLGYVAGKAEGTIVFDDSQADPKDLINEFVQYLEAGKLAKNKAFDQAKQILLKLIPQCPEFYEIYQMLGDIEVTQGNFGQSLPYFRRAVELNPTETGGMNNLAWIQATRPSLPSRDVAEALRMAKKLCEQTNFNDPNTLDTLAVTYAAVGDFSNAVQTASKAVRMAKSMNENELAGKLLGRLKLFEQSKPYIEE